MSEKFLSGTKKTQTKDGLGEILQYPKGCFVILEGITIPDSIQSGCWTSTTIIAIFCPDLINYAAIAIT